MTSIAHFNILEPIGIDGIGEMFRARDTKVGRTVAVKVVGQQLAGDPAALARLLEDARLASNLSHPNIAALWEYGEADGRTYLSDQRFYGPLRARSVPGWVRRFFGGHAFLIPLDIPASSS